MKFKTLIFALLVMVMSVSTLYSQAHDTPRERRQKQRFINNLEKSKNREFEKTRKSKSSSSSSSCFIVSAVN